MVMALFPEFFAIAMVIVAGVLAFRRMDRLFMAAASAVFLASYLANRLGCRAYLVDHPVLGLITANLRPNYDDLFLRNPDRLVAPRTQIDAHLKPLPVACSYGKSATP